MPFHEFRAVPLLHRCLNPSDGNPEKPPNGQIPSILRKTDTPGSRNLSWQHKNQIRAVARKTTCMTETSVTKYISACADGTEEKGPAMPRLKAPCGHREIQSRHKVQRREMRQAPPPREMERSRQVEAHRMHPVHVSLTRMRHGDSLPSKLAASPWGKTCCNIPAHRFRNFSSRQMEP